jgi:hypothetical protein
MHIRDAVEADAAALAALAGAPRDVMRNLVHDRTVRVATDDQPDEDTGDGAGTGAGAEAEAGTGTGTGDGHDDDVESFVRGDHGDGEESDRGLLGFVSFDVRDGTVHVTQIGGDRDACERLLEEPVRFATREDLDAELLVAHDDGDTRRAAESVGFRRRGSGPTFEGNQTVRYRLVTEDAESR